MDINEASSMLAALAQSTRLQAFRLLVGHEPGGLPAGDIARKLGIPQNTSSTHLAILVNLEDEDEDEDEPVQPPEHDDAWWEKLGKSVEEVSHG